LIYDMYILFI